MSQLDWTWTWLELSLATLLVPRLVTLYLWFLVVIRHLEFFYVICFFCYKKKASDWPRGRHSFALKLGEPMRMSPFPFRQSGVKLQTDTQTCWSKTKHCQNRHIMDIKVYQLDLWASTESSAYIKFMIICIYHNDM